MLTKNLVLQIQSLKKLRQLKKRNHFIAQCLVHINKKNEILIDGEAEERHERVKSTTGHVGEFPCEI